MNRTIRELLATPFEDLSATRGVGAKKIGGLLQLLGRVAEPTSLPAAQPVEIEPSDTASAAAVPHEVEGASAETLLPVGFEESMWKAWRESVERLGLANETLGRFAPSLVELPRTLWTVRLGNYLPLRLAEVRALRAHGEKRMKAVLEIFAAVHRSTANAEPAAHLAICVWPHRVLHLDHWARTTAHATGFPSLEDVQRKFVEPLAEQLRIDAGPELADWAATQLDLLRAAASRSEDSPTERLSQPSGFYMRKLAAVVGVRWPEGEGHVRAVQARLSDFQATTPAARLFQAAAGVFFPGLTAGFSSNASVADELFQWPQRRTIGTTGQSSRAGNKRSLRQRQRNASSPEPGGERSARPASSLRFAEQAPALAP